MRFTSQIGRCLLICQEAEGIFAFIIMLKRHPGVHAFDESMIAELVAIRTTFFGRLEQELISSGNGLLDQDEVTKFSINRNWLVHHLILDPRYINASKTGGFDLSSTLVEMQSSLDSFKTAYTELFKRDGGMDRLKDSKFTPEDAELVSRIVSHAIIKKKGWA